MSHRDRVLTLLRTLHEARETLQRGDTGGSFEPDSRILSMPSVYHEGDYKALETALANLRRLYPRHYWQLANRYLACERMTARLAELDGRYYRTVRTSEGLALGEPFEDDGQVFVRIILVAQGTTPIRHKGRHARQVWAALERWSGEVAPALLEEAEDLVCAFMPKRPRLPRAIYQAAKVAA